ncbi:MAG: heparinase, partial [Cytophagales bacterium]
MRILSQMGARYVLYRIWFTFKIKSGILRLQTPQSFKQTIKTDFEKWKSTSLFFFDSRPENPQNYQLDKSVLEQLSETAHKINKGNIQFFHAEWKNLGLEDDWVTNPQTGFKYDKNQHWSNIPDFDSKKGDIKYVWERSRFSFLFDLIRDEFWNGSDHFDFVFETILDWIEKNPLNSGPNFKCAQEISIRVLNWCFVLHFYKNNPKLIHYWHIITKSIHGQVKHVDATLNFSLI